jgi:O-antigen/teichoic acid export membrane protein
MKAATFAKETALTLAARIAGLLLALVTSVVIARTLGPEGNGIYTLATLFPVLLVTFTNLGIGPATVYYVAQERYPLPEVLGNNVVLSAITGSVASVLGVIVVVLLQDRFFPTVAPQYLMLAIVMVPLILFGQHYVNQILLGAMRIRQFNAATLLYKFFLLVLVLLATVGLGLGIAGALWATVLSSLLLCVVLFPWIKKLAGGVRFRLNLEYVRHTLDYGIRAHLGNIVGFLNYRIEVFILGVFLPAATVGFYAVAVGLAEKLWFVSESASVVLFPTVSAETSEQQKKQFTPLVSRSVLLITAVGAVALYVVSHWAIVLLYSDEYVATVSLFRILLPGIVFLSAGRILANDIAGRGKPLLNTYVGLIGLAVQVVLDLAWIPPFGATGAAWATTVSYGITSAVRLGAYMKLSGNSWASVIIPQGSDWPLYRQLARLAWTSLRRQMGHC